MMTYDNAQGSQASRATEAQRTCPGCGGVTGQPDHNHPAGVLSCGLCGRAWRPVAAEPVEALPKPTPSDAVTSDGATLLAAGLEAGLVETRGGRYYHDGTHLGHGERAAAEALDGSQDLAAALAAELDAIKADPAPGAEDEEG